MDFLTALLSSWSFLVYMGGVLALGIGASVWMKKSEKKCDKDLEDYKTLIDGSIMIFPKKNKEKNESSASAAVDEFGIQRDVKKSRFFLQDRSKNYEKYIGGSRFFLEMPFRSFDQNYDKYWDIAAEELVKNSPVLYVADEEFAEKYENLRLEGTIHGTALWVFDNEFSVGKQIAQLSREGSELVEKKESYLRSLKSKKHADPEVVELFDNKIEQLHKEIDELVKQFMSDVEAKFDGEIETADQKTWDADVEETIKTLKEAKMKELSPNPQTDSLTDEYAFRPYSHDSLKERAL